MSNETTPMASEFYGDRRKAISAPTDLVPAGMQEIKVRDVCNGGLYCRTFRKPRAEGVRQLQWQLRRNNRGDKSPSAYDLEWPASGE